MKKRAAKEIWIEGIMRLTQTSNHKLMFFLTMVFPYLLNCQHFTNPFEHFDNADLTIDSHTTFSTQWTDTLDIFSNDTLFLAATVPELIDSYTVIVSHNRHFPQKTMIKPKATPCSFRISAYDTGNQTITIDVYRRDGNIKSSNILFFTRNPLYQDSLLSCVLSDSITLQTVPVQDNSRVLYTWILDHHTVRSPFSLVRTKPTQMDNNVRIGHLYVSDSLFKSPEVTFKFSFTDNTPPEIICLNDLNKITKTVRTADSIFIFRVKVEDNNESHVVYVGFNGNQAESISNNIYSKVLNNAYTFTQEYPYRMIVTAMDNDIFRNISSDTFNIVYDALHLKNDTTFITLNKLNGDTLWTSANPVILNGSVSNSDGKHVNLKATLNSSPLFDTPFPSGCGMWSYPCPLTFERNNLTLKAYSEKGALLSEKMLTIIYNEEFIDTTSPVLASVLINNFESKLHYVSSDSAQLSFYAYDFGSGIADVIINKTDTLSVTTGQSLWRRSIYNIKHEWESIAIDVIDYSKNMVSDSLLVCFNRLPTVMPSELPYAIEIDMEYSGQLFLSDPDNDTLEVIILHSPPDMVFSDDEKQFSWFPLIENTGIDSLVFQIYDKIQTSERYCWNYMVYDPASVNGSISLAKNQNIPRFLKALQDTLNLSIELGEPSGTPPYTYRIQILTKSSILDSVSEDGKITWTAAIEDTGECQIRLYVLDGLEHADTAISQLQIVPPNCDSAELIFKSITGGEFIDSNSLFLTVPDSSSLLTFDIKDSDHPLTEKYDITVVMNGFTTKFTPAEKQFQFSIIPPSFNNDTVIITLKDNTRLKPDSLLFTIINPIASPDLISGIQRWFKPEDFSATIFSLTWNEYISTYNNLTANTGVSSINNSLNGNPTVKLSSSYLTNIDGGNWMATPFSIFILAKYDTLPGSNQALLTNFNQSVLSSFSFGLSFEGQLIAFTNTFLTSNTVKTSLITEKGNWYIYSFCSNGINDDNSISAKIGVNRSFEDITVTNVPDEASMSIGSHDRTNNWTGEIAEILHYNRVLNSAELKRVIGYLMKKYDLR